MKLSSLWIAVLTGLVATLLWDTVLLLPLKLLIVLVHEMMHGLFALIGGGQLEGIHINPEEAGETLVSGLDSFWGFLMTVSAGYIGSALIGALLLRRGLKGSGARGTLIMFALCLAAMSHLFTEQGSLAAYVGMGWAFGILLMILPGERAAGILLVVLGTLFVWYSFFDLFDFTAQVDSTDAGILAAYLDQRLGSGTGEPATGLAYAISAVWSVLIVAMILLVLRPLLSSGESATPDAVPHPDDFAPPAPAFPGEITPEIADWLMQRGLGPDGEPLVPPPEAGFESIEPGEFGFQPGEFGSAAPAGTDPVYAAGPAPEPASFGATAAEDGFGPAQQAASR